MTWRIEQGDWIEVLRTMPDESVHCVVTSPPYWGLRDYGACSCGSGRFDMGQGEGTGGNLNYRAATKFDAACPKCQGTGRIIGTERQLGLERTPDEYVAKMVEGFREVRRVLRNDGTLWLNLGDSYNAHPGQRTVHDKAGYKQSTNRGSCEAASRNTPTMKAKDLCGIPWMVAFALRSDGWYLRQDIIWAKPNPMPESVRDRCTKAHEYIFLLSKSERYYYDQDAVAEAVARTWDETNIGKDNGWVTGEKEGKVLGRATNPNGGLANCLPNQDGTRNRRSVWSVTTKPFPEAHFATFPPEIPETCIKAGCPENGTVLDPFNGAGTTGLVATRLGRNYIGIELNPDYIEMATRRIENDAPLFNIQTGDMDEGSLHSGTVQS